MDGIQDFRLNEKCNVQIKFKNRWRNLHYFTEACPYGRYAYKESNVPKCFNPYVFFEGDDVEKIEKYLNS